MWPGNTADVTSLVPVIDRLRRRFAIGRVCVVADRGMISAETIAALEQRGLLYNHLYRAMAWLGEELPADQQDGATRFAPRCSKDLIEEHLFAHRRDLFSRLDLVFMDTTSLSFEGLDGQSIGQYGERA